MYPVDVWIGIRRTALFVVLLSGLATFTPSFVFGSQSVTLAWNPSTNTDVVNYAIYYGTASRTYTNMVTVGNVTNATISGLTEGVTYYFAATAANASGVQSDFSNETSYQAPKLQVNPTSIAYGTVLNGTSKTATFTVSNTGGGTLIGTASVSAPFSITSGGTYSLGANQSQTVTVVFSPTVAGNYSQNVTLTGGGNTTVGLSGAATNAPINPVIQVTPANIAYNTVLVGTSKTATFTVSNTGGGTLSGTASVSAPFSITSGGTYSLGANQSQTVTVVFSPTAAGNFSQNVTLTGGGNATVGLSGAATNAPINPVIQVTPANIAYNTVLVGTSKTATFTVSNTGGGTLNGTASVSAPFSITSGGTYNLGSNQSQTVTVVFSPTAAGNFSQNVTLTGGGNATVGLSGAATNASPALPSVSAISVNATDVDSGMPGLQIYSGTTVQLSAKATNAQTWQWSYTVNGGSSVVYTNSASPITNISYSYGPNTAGNTYVWTLVVSNAASWAESETNLTVETAPGTGGTVTTNIIAGPTIAATSGTLNELFTASSVINGTTVSYIYQPLLAIGSSIGGSATYNVTTTNAGTYEIQASVYAPNTSANSFMVNIDGQPQNPSMIWDILPLTSGFEQRLVSWRGNGTPNDDQIVPKTFTLNAGQHQIIFVGMEPGTAMASFTLMQVVVSTNTVQTTSSATPNATLQVNGAIAPNGQFTVSVNGISGDRYVVQVSTNLVNWVPVQTNTAPFVFTDPDSGKFKQRFYRSFHLP